MTKLEQLIQDLCPDGVEYKTLGEIGSFFGGITGKNKDDFKNGNAKFITYRNAYSNPSLQLEVADRVRISENEKQRTLQYGDIIFTGSSETPDECGISSVLTTKTDEALYLNSFCFFLRLNNPSILLPDFSKHLFRSSKLRYQIGRTASGVTRFNVSKDKMKKIRIPIPPLEVQAEIARILDKFTELTTELTTKLATELANRKKQYEYYRNNLLTFNTNVEMKKLKDVSESIASGKNKNRSESGKYPVYGSTGIIAKTNVPVFSKKQILVARVGANAGYVHIADGEYDVSDNTLIIDIKTGYSIKYIYHYLVNKNLNQFAKGGGQPLITAGQLKELQLPVPNIEVQERIVNVLDNFEAICCDLNIGLPAEIEARQKQYEYYRDKLLQFAIRN